jgi:peroxiredoxin Q/BCP
MSGFLELFFPWMARSEMLKPGDPAPDFSTSAIVDDQIVPVRLIDYRGHKVVLYFYPKDNTPGCTREACAFRDGYARLRGWGIALLGCSIDAESTHRAFAKKYRLPFPLLLDPGNKIAKAYRADNGIPILGLDRRVTYVIDEEGRILRVYPRVDPAAHASEIIHDLGADKPLPTSLATPSPTPTPPPRHGSPRQKEPPDDSE